MGSDDGQQVVPLQKLAAGTVAEGTREAEGTVRMGLTGGVGSQVLSIACTY